MIELHRPCGHHRPEPTPWLVEAKDLRSTSCAALSPPTDCLLSPIREFLNHHDSDNAQCIWSSESGIRGCYSWLQFPRFECIADHAREASFSDHTRTAKRIVFATRSAPVNGKINPYDGVASRAFRLAVTGNHFSLAGVANFHPCHRNIVWFGSEVRSW